MADQLRGEMDMLIEKQRKAKALTWEFYEEYKKWKAQENETEQEFHFRSYQMWSDEKHRLGKEI